MTESNDFRSQSLSELRSAALNSLRKAFLKMSGASGSQPRRLSAPLLTFDRSLHALNRNLRAKVFGLVMAVFLSLTMMVTSARVCNSQDAPPPSTTDKDTAAQNQTQKRTDSATQPAGQGRMFGFLP